ncbi:hypothetical protein ACFE33_01820 [Falsihalocynthiibacter sp. SS001]|uniref:hypothetical protein n=1 Tax=Falsihalocynthiibacter sp. SS001 TaxID=3349698 RepID=UPI0036D29D7D
MAYGSVENPIDIISLFSAEIKMQIQSKFTGIIVKNEKCHKFTIKSCPDKHSGLGRVLVHFKRRDNSKRFQIVRILTPKGKAAYAAVIGHYESPDYIKMDYDLRDELGLSVGETTLLEIKRCGPFETVYWYLTARDPLIKVPAVLALTSVGMGVVSLIISLRS